MARAILGTLLALVAIAEIFFPGASVYHAGWFNVAIVALMVLFAWRAPARLLATVFGIAIVVFATIASGLLGPDDQVIVASPGESVQLGAAGTLQFPLDTDMAAVRGRVYRGAFALESIPRTVVRVEASDSRGARLTITQPTGEAFLSPVLLMRSTQEIGGFTLPFDSFAVPAMHRAVKAVLFGPKDSARMATLAPGWNVLFDLQDDNERQIPQGIGVVPDGATRTIAGLQLHVAVVQYPGVRVMSIPDWRAVAGGLLLALAGILAPRFLTKRARL